MTSDALDNLRQITNLDTLKENQQLANVRRPDGRHPLIDFEADVKVSGPYTVRGERKDGSEWSNEVVRLACSNIITFRSRLPFEENYAEIDIPLSQRADSSLGLTVASLNELDSNCQSVVDFDGKRVHLVDSVASLGWDRKFTRRDGTEGSEPATAWYYKAVEIVGAAKGAGKNGSKAASVSTEAQDAALAYCVGKNADELQSGPGIQEFIKHLNSQSLLEVPLQSEIVGRKFVNRMIGEGKLAASEEGLVLV